MSLDGAAAGELHPDPHPRFPEDAGEFGRLEAAHPLAEEVDGAGLGPVFHQTEAGGDCPFEAGQVVFAFKVLGVDRHKRDAVLLRVAVGKGVGVIPDDLDDAGGDDEDRFGAVLRHQFGDRLVQFGLAAEGDVPGCPAPPRRSGRAARRRSSEWMVMCLGVVGRTRRSPTTSSTASRIPPDGHRRPHQRAVGAGEQRAGELGGCPSSRSRPAVCPGWERISFPSILSVSSPFYLDHALGAAHALLRVEKP